MMEETEAPLGPGDDNEETQQETNNESMESLMQAEDSGLEFPNQGEIRTGVIATISATQILVSVGAKSEGVLTGRELDQIPPAEREAFQIGQEIHVFVVNPEDQNGNIVLSFTRAQEQMGWERVEKMVETGEDYEGKVEGFNKGGLIVGVYGLRGFIPASQISMARRNASQGDTPEQRWAKMSGDAITVRVIEVDRARRRLILSERAAVKESREAQKDRLLSEIKVGEVRKGHVISLAEFGAFVDIGGADGLVHLSELSWKRVNHPNEILKVGQEVEVVVLNVDRERKRIGLSMKRREDDPWLAIQKKYQVGQLVAATITKLTKFGAFARIEGEDDIEGLIHISELAEGHIDHPKEVVAEGQNVTLRVVKVDAEKRRMGLSLKRVASSAYADTDWEQVAASLDLDEVATEDK